MLLGQQPLLAWPGSLCGSVQHFFMQSWIVSAQFESFVAGHFQLMLRPMKVAEAILQSRDLSLPSEWESCPDLAQATMQHFPVCRSLLN